MNIDNLTNLQRWLAAIEQRPACQRGIKVPVDISAMLAEQKDAGDEFAKNVATMVTR